MPTISIRKYVPRGTTVVTEDNQKLTFGGEGRRFGGYVDLDVQLSIEPDRPEGRSDLIRAISRFTDESGQGWQTIDLIRVEELYLDSLREPLFAHAVDVRSPIVSNLAPPLDEVRSISLIQGALISLDDGIRRPVCVLREIPGWKSDFERFEHLMFLISDKSFCAEAELVERIRSRHSPKPYEARSLHLHVFPQTSPTTSTAISAQGDPIHIPRVDYCDLAPLSAEIRLRDYLWCSAWKREREDDREFWVQQRPLVAPFQPTSPVGSPTPGIRAEK